jgi:hypothetical protein
MKRRFLVAAALLALGAPAHATSGYSCSTSGANPILIDIVIGHAVAPLIAQVRLTENERIWSTAGDPPDLSIAQSWIDDKELRLDLTDPNVERYEARLRLRIKSELAATGTLERNDKSYKLSCSGG